MTARLLAASVAAFVCIFSSGCDRRHDISAQTVDGTTYGVTTVPFRGRWWHYYERGVSWLDGGFLDQAEADFRQCLQLRWTDRRRARTYGMRFSQYFAHRELGAVLLRRGALDEAERELRVSLEQEPSAKAEYLLERVRAQRLAVAPPEPIHIAADAHAASAAGEWASVAIERIIQVGERWRISGSVQSRDKLWYVSGEQATRIPLDHGEFDIDVPINASLALGPAHEQTFPLAALGHAGEAPELTLDGPEDGKIVSGRVWYRYQAQARDSLAHMSVLDDEGVRADVALRGVRAAGMLALDLTEGEHRLKFTVEDRTGHRSEIARTLTVRPSPHQDRSLRAVALAVPLQSPRPTAIRTIDDPMLLSAMNKDGRFRFVDRRADTVLERELKLLDAGLLDRTTAAHAGKRLQCRYVVAGTIMRGAGDIECYVRLITSATGELVAAADAYAEGLESGRENEFFQAVAGRLRQAFPVIEVTTTIAGDAVVLAAGNRDGVLPRMRFSILSDNTGATKPPPVQATIEVVRCDERAARADIVSGTPARQAQAISE
jgi:hypothetical protein